MILGNIQVFGNYECINNSRFFDSIKSCIVKTPNVSFDNACKFDSYLKVLWPKSS